MEQYIPYSLLCNLFSRNLETYYVIGDKEKTFGCITNLGILKKNNNNNVLLSRPRSTPKRYTCTTPTGSRTVLTTARPSMASAAIFVFPRPG